MSYLFSKQIKTIVALFALVASASAFAPQQPTAFARSKIVVFGDYGKYDEQLWDMDAKLDVYNTWDPNSPRSAANFNPFETYEGNSPDASGFYPGEGRYKDPVRPDVNFAAMQAERKVGYDWMVFTDQTT